jgi:hypothetical protein
MKIFRCFFFNIRHCRSFLYINQALQKVKKNLSRSKGNKIKGNRIAVTDMTEFSQYIALRARAREREIKKK